VNDRIARLRARLDEPFLVTDPTNVFWLVGFKSSNAALLVDHERVQLFADFRYAAAARAVDGVEFVETKRALLGDLGARLHGRVGFEADQVTFAGWEALSAHEVEAVPRPGLLKELRAVKEEQELESLRAAWEITDAVFDGLADETFVGRTEREVAWAIERRLRDAGSEPVKYEVIVASGPNAARPHSRPSDRKIESRETVVVDAGAVVGGYTADCTRTFATGPLDGDLKEAYEVVLGAQNAGLEAVRAGASGVEVDAAARQVVDATRFAGTFGHGLGHGVGLDVHELPTLRPESDSTLEPGNVVTVEPGIYLEGRGGIRVEDNVVVTDGGSENLTSARKDLTEVS
jgi:Xaa-Pro aminopeptidase